MPAIKQNIVFTGAANVPKCEHGRSGKAEALAPEAAQRHVAHLAFLPSPKESTALVKYCITCSAISRISSADRIASFFTPLPVAFLNAAHNATLVRSVT